MAGSPVAVPKALLIEVCARYGIREADHFWVLDMVRNPGAAPACCGSGCDPCVDDVAAAAETIRRRLGLAEV